MYNLNGGKYYFGDKEKFISEVKDSLGGDNHKKYPWDWQYNKREQKTEHILSVPCAFDTETTSYTIHIKNKEVKTGFIYVWMFGINGITIAGRTWEQFLELIKDLKKALWLNNDWRIICYIHNMQFDMQFLRKYLKFDKTFVMDTRKMLYAISDGIEWRCSYILTNNSLANVGKNLLKYKVEKLVGDLDYDLKRHYKTPLTEKEWEYCFNDVRVQMAYTQELIEDYNGRITEIPLTSTGFVREDVKRSVLANKKVARMIHTLKLSLDEYDMWKEAFQGGHTHGNIWYSGETCEDVVSMDFTSSYPSVMIAEKFPMTNGEIIELEREEQIIETHKYCYLMRMKLENVKLCDGMADAIISKSKCRGVKGAIVDNGKIREAKELYLTCTNTTYEVLKNFYEFDAPIISKCYRYGLGYLPKEIIECILDYYEKKTTLKDVLGRESDYMKGKQKVNAIFGMMVMDIVREVMEYENEWLPTEELTEDERYKQIEDYNEKKTRFTWYPWGCMITDYARRNLLNGIYNLGMDYIYADTDSVKVFNYEKHKDYFEDYNYLVTKKLERTLEYYNIPVEKLRPKTIKGKEKPLGVWDFDGHYFKFKYLHSKCYIGDLDDEKDGGLHCTVAGVPKKKIKEALEKYVDPFEVFQVGFELTKEESGKLCSHYCDDEYTFEVTDYLGDTETVTTKSGICLEKIPFVIGETDMYQTVMEYLGIGKGE